MEFKDNLLLIENIKLYKWILEMGTEHRRIKKLPRYDFDLKNAKIQRIVDFLREPDEEESKVSNDDLDLETEWPNREFVIRTPELAEQIFHKNKGLAFSATKNFKKFVCYKLPLDDLNQIIYKAFWGACLTWDQSKGYLSTWSYLIVPRRVRHEIYKFYFRPDSYGAILSSSQHNLKEAMANKNISLLEKLIFDELIEVNYKINNMRDADILVERILWDQTLAECGSDRGLTRERIRQLESRALLKLRSFYGSNNNRVKFIS